MKLHRLALTNYRGVTHREIEFPDRGVVVISGPNEIGKSSILEAVDLLLEAKDRSTKKEVKQVKPTHADVGAEVTAEISTGPYRFVYRKRFHKRCETELTVLAPRREQLTGDEAHERVRSMLDETVDMDLWRAQRIVQAEPTAAVDLSGCDALSRALDVAAGQADSLSGAEPLLIDRIDAEYQRYFTATGRPTAEWATVISRLRDADDAVARRAAAVAEVDEAVRRHAMLTEALGQVTVEHADASQELARAQAAADIVAALTEQVKQARLVADAAQAKHAASLAALTERRRLRAEIEDRVAAVGELESAAGAAAADDGKARTALQAAEAAAEDAREAVQKTQARVEAARGALERLADRDEADRLATRLAKIDAVQRERGRVERELAGITLTEQGMRDIEVAAVAVERASAALELASARIELVAHRDVEARVGGVAVPLQSGDIWAVTAATATDIEMPGLLTVRLIPGAPASDTHAKLDAAQQVLDVSLAGAGAADVVSARAVDERRRELVAAADRLTASGEGLLGGDCVDAMRTRLTQLREREPAEPGLWDGGDSTAVRTELQTARIAHQQAVGDCETRRKLAALAAKELGEKSTRATAGREKLAAARLELALARERVAQLRSDLADDALAITAEAHGEQARRTQGHVAELGAQLARSAPDEVAAALDDPKRRAGSLQTRCGELNEALRDVAAQLKVYGTEGRKGDLDAAETEREHAAAEHLRVRRRARAAQLLRTVMVRHRDATRLRYVDPFRNEVERLGCIVFGDSFEVEVDSRLQICSRTLAGRTVPYESLSGGAKEQLGIVARLAGAALVAKEDTVPVLIDDALGFTDADRLAKMCAVFDAVGGDGQVIVLTCSPQRYSGIRDATRIELTA